SRRRTGSSRESKRTASIERITSFIQCRQRQPSRRQRSHSSAVGTEKPRSAGDNRRRRSFHLWSQRAVAGNGKGPILRRSPVQWFVLPSHSAQYYGLVRVIAALTCEARASPSALTPIARILRRPVPSEAGGSNAGLSVQLNVRT